MYIVIRVSCGGGTGVRSRRAWLPVFKGTQCGRPLFAPESTKNMPFYAIEECKIPHRNRFSGLRLSPLLNWDSSLLSQSASITRPFERYSIKLHLVT